MLESSFLIHIGEVVCKKLPRKLQTILAYRLAQVSAKGMTRCQVYPGVFLDLDLGDWIQRLYYLGQVDQSQLHLVKSLIPFGGTFVDIGANVGLYTCVIADHVGQTGFVLAFEPMPENIVLLRRNIILNGLANVDVEPVALSNRIGMVDLYVPSVHPGGPSAATRIQNPGDWRVIGKVRSTTLDESFSGCRLDLIKIDVDGHEVEVLEGAQKVVGHFRPVIVCEVQEQNLGAVIEYAKAWGYDLFANSSMGRVGSLIARADGDLFLVPKEKPVACAMVSQR
jgi:FkbM family methyltransferase